MKKRRVRWSKSVDTAQFGRSFLGAERLLTGEFVLFLLCVMLFFGSACGMLNRMFEWEFSLAEVLNRVFFMTLFVSVLVEGTALLKGKWRALARIGIVFGGLLLFAFYLFETKQGENVIQGFYAIGAMYLKEWNSYYRTRIPYMVGDVFQMKAALHFTVNVLCFLSLWLVRVGKKTLVLAAVPLSVVVGGLLIGITPQGIGLFVMLLGCFLANMAEYRRTEFVVAPGSNKSDRGDVSPILRQFFWVPVGVVFVILFLVVGIKGKSSAEETVYSGEKKLQEKQEKLTDAIIEWDGWEKYASFEKVEKKLNELLGKTSENTRIYEKSHAYLDNSKPEYEEVTVLKVVLDKYFSGKLYLVGFYADEYTDGVWGTDVFRFEDECRDAGFDPDEVSAEILHYGGNQIEQMKENAKETKFLKDERDGWLYYAKGNLRKAFMPYMASSDTEGLRPEGDSRYVKDTGVTKVPFHMYNIDTKALTYFVLDIEIDEYRSPQKKDWEVWYEDYVEEHYLTVPYGMSQVKKVAEEIQEGVWYQPETEEEYGECLYRIRTVSLVANWLSNWTRYTLDLPELPKGEDPIEFFLGTSREGYCMHYASAAVMILRELGIPARYVSGYVTDTFKKDELLGKYVSVVPDSNAHAWVEIYLNGFGWVPIDMTNSHTLPGAQSVIVGEVVMQNPGTDPSEVRVTVDIVNDILNRENEGGEEQKNEERENTEKEDAPQSTQTPGRDTAQTPENIGPGQNAGDGRNSGTKDSGEEEKKDLSVNPVILLFVLLFMIIMNIVMIPISRAYRNTRSAADERKMERRVGRFGNRQKIYWLNRNLYRKLRTRGQLLKKYPSDEEYKELLRAFREVVSSEERERFLHLAKAAAFSYEEFTKEEVMFCRDVYHRILYVKKYEVEER